jgi:hypothetical protein
VVRSRIVRPALRIALAAGVALLAGPVRGEEGELRMMVEDLAERVRELESSRSETGSGGAAWTERVRLSGSADVGYYGGQSDSVFEEDAFAVRDLRLFVDADLGRDVRAGEHLLVRNVGFTFEWNLVRIGTLQNDVGEAYVDLQAIGGLPWLNVQVGRFQIPVGEEYLRYSKGFAYRPLISSTVGGPWWWDEGIRIYGDAFGGRFGWVASITNGDTPFNVDSDGDKQATLKLIVEPLDWLRISGSVLRSGRIGRADTGASGALWLGEMWARSFGGPSSVPNYVDGVVVPDGPNKLTDTLLFAGDVVVDFPEQLRLWLAYGTYEIETNGPSRYDRNIEYWIAELILRGGLLAPELSRAWLALRANGLGTYDDGRGYLLDARRRNTLGFNMESMTVYSVGLGWELSHGLTLRAEYSFQHVDTVDGVTAALRDVADRADLFGIELGAHF